MYKTLELKRINRQAKKVGKVFVKAQAYVSVQVIENDNTIYGLNVHDDGKQEFFVNSTYSMPQGFAYKHMLAIVQAFKGA